MNTAFAIRKLVVDVTKPPPPSRAVFHGQWIPRGSDSVISDHPSQVLTSVMWCLRPLLVMVHSGKPNYCTYFKHRKVKTGSSLYKCGGCLNSKGRGGISRDVKQKQVANQSQGTTTLGCGPHASNAAEPLDTRPQWPLGLRCSCSDSPGGDAPETTPRAAEPQASFSHPQSPLLLLWAEVHVPVKGNK